MHDPLSIFIMRIITGILYQRLIAQSASKMFYLLQTVFFCCCRQRGFARIENTSKTTEKNNESKTHKIILGNNTDTIDIQFPAPLGVL